MSFYQFLLVIVATQGFFISEFINGFKYNCMRKRYT